MPQYQDRHFECLNFYCYFFTQLHCTELQCSAVYLYFPGGAPQLEVPHPICSELCESSPGGQTHSPGVVSHSLGVWPAMAGGRLLHLYHSKHPEGVVKCPLLPGLDEGVTVSRQGLAREPQGGTVSLYYPPNPQLLCYPIFVLSSFPDFPSAPHTSVLILVYNILIFV